MIRPLCVQYRVICLESYLRNWFESARVNAQFQFDFEIGRVALLISVAYLPEGAEVRWSRPDDVIDRDRVD